MADLARRHVYFWERRTLYATTSNVTGWHRHFGASIAVSTRDTFRLETRERGGRYAAALVPPNLEHRALVPDARMVVLIVDPDSPDFRPLLRGLRPSSIRAIEGSVFAASREALDRIVDGRAAPAEVEACAASMVSLLARQEAVVLDPRVATVLERIRASFPDVPPLATLAADVGLSPNRLMTVFKKSLGLPIRRYLLWLRLRGCVRWLVDGANLTDTAHAAGFADSAHFSRVFRENFGMRPSEVFSADGSTVVRVMDAAARP